jgi:hypothetical protein
MWPERKYHCSTLAQSHDFIVRKYVQIGVSVVCLGVVLGGVRYAWTRESVRKTDKQALYQKINRESFDGQLPDVRVEWTNSDGKYYGITDGTKIEIDAELVTSEAQLINVLRHAVLTKRTTPD